MKAVSVPAQPPLFRVQLSGDTGEKPGTRPFRPAEWGPPPCTAPTPQALLPATPPAPCRADCSGVTGGSPASDRLVPLPTPPRFVLCTRCPPSLLRTAGPPVCVPVTRVLPPAVGVRVTPASWLLRAAPLRTRVCKCLLKTRLSVGAGTRTQKPEIMSRLARIFGGAATPLP